MPLYVMTIVATLISTAIAFDKDRNVVGWYCLTLALPLVMFQWMGEYAASIAVSMLPVALLALLPSAEPEEAPKTRRVAKVAAVAGYARR